MFLLNLKYRVIKFIEEIPLIQIFIYNNIIKFKFLFPHDKDYLALKLLFKFNEKRDFIDVGGNIGLSVVGFRELGYRNNRILVFEPDKLLIKNYLNKVKNLYKKILIFNFGLSNKNETKTLFKAFYKNKFFHFNNSFDKKYIKEKIKHNYPKKYKKFYLKSQKLYTKRFDTLKIQSNACFVKIDVEGFDHCVIDGMRNFIKKIKPVLLIEYNYNNFALIYNKLRIDYYCYIYDIEKDNFRKLKKNDIKKLKMGKILEKKYSKNSVNIFYINKSLKIGNN